MKMPPGEYESLKQDIAAVAAQLGIDVATADPGRTGLKTMFVLLDTVSRNRAFTDEHPKFANGLWPRLLPYDGRNFNWYMGGGRTAVDMANSLRLIRSELTAEAQMANIALLPHRQASAALAMPR